MPEFFLELLSEEIPARFQQQAEKDLEHAFKSALQKHQLSFAHLQTFSTPKRLGIYIEGLPLVQDDQTEERKGPAVDAPPQAIQGFLNSIQKDRSACVEKSVDGKGPFLFATLTQKGQPTSQILKEITETLIHGFKWPKSMWWKTASFYWARPLHNIYAIFNKEVVPIYIEPIGLSADAHTTGHRFMSRHLVEARTFEAYKKSLYQNYVIIDQSQRKEIIKTGIKQVLPLGIHLIEDDGLLNETANLVEWPVVLLGQIDPKFMDLPEEVLITSMKVHQKYFATRDANGKLSPYFLIVSNMETADQGQQIIDGNERVLRARLSDAMFFWKQDTQKPLSAHNEPLKNRVFQKDLGTLYEKVMRLQKLGQTLSKHFAGIAPSSAKEALSLLKADLSTGMVGEFPELQGIMGGHYALAEGKSTEVATAIKEHYAPEGPQDTCPQSSLGQFVALVDKIDSLLGFFGAGLTATASKDPYGLRRLSLSIIRILHENEILIPLPLLLKEAAEVYQFKNKEQLIETVLSFIKDRLEVYFKPVYDIHLVRAGFGPTWDGSVGLLSLKLNALKSFLDSPKGQDFLTVYERASNILKGQQPSEALDVTLLGDDEKNLYSAIQTTESEIKSAYSHDVPQYKKLIESLADLKAPLESFFNNVLVNDDDLRLKTNRLALLGKVKHLATAHFDMGKLLNT